MMNDIKECKCCKKWKFKIDFHKSSSSKDGFKPECKKCRRKINNEIADRIRKQNTDKYIKKIGLTCYKECSKCNKTKLLKYFKVRKDLKSGYSTMCTKCHNIKSNIYYHNNSDKIAIQSKARRKPEVEKERNKLYRENNHEKEMLRQLKYRCFKMANEVIDNVDILTNHCIKLRSIRLDRGLELFKENSVEYIIIRKAQGILFEEADKRNINVRMDLI